MVVEVLLPDSRSEEHVPHTEACRLLRPLQDPLNALTSVQPPAAGTLALTGKLDARSIVLSVGGRIQFWSCPTLTALLKEAGFQLVAFLGASRCLWRSKLMQLAARKPLA